MTRIEVAAAMLLRLDQLHSFGDCSMTGPFRGLCNLTRRRRIEQMARTGKSRAGETGAMLRMRFPILLLAPS